MILSALFLRGRQEFRFIAQADFLQVGSLFGRCHRIGLRDSTLVNDIGSVGRYRAVVNKKKCPRVARALSAADADYQIALPLASFRLAFQLS